MDDADAVEALKRLGLSTYEARAFVALQKLGVGSASEVADIADVPRSQVYGAAGSLEERGLVDVQQGTPTRYRPVGLDEAERRLLEQVQAEGERAFDYLEGVRGQHAAGAEDREAIWLVHGTDSVAARAVELVEGADDRVVYAASNPDLFESALADALRSRAAAGVDVTVVSSEASMLDSFRGDDGVEVVLLPDLPITEVQSGRTLLVDDDTVLMTVLPSADLPHIERETAFWSEGTAFATLLVSFIDQGMASLFDAVEAAE